MDNILLSPFIYVLELLFSISKSISPNIGISILTLSILVYLITFPLIKLVERLSYKEEAKKEKINHLIKEINAAYKGQTRFFYTKALYKIHNINPLSDLFGIAKLLVQIPFFLSAYHYLSSLHVFNSQSFLFITDLSKVDQAIPFAGIYMNVLPILMFIINSLSAKVFAKENKNEFLTLFLTGILFLILLYSMPAALVLYWTCNNLISLIVESYKSKGWIKKKLKAINFSSNLKSFANRSDHTILFLCFLLLSLVYSYSHVSSNLTSKPYYILIVFSLIGFVTLLFLELTGRLKSYEENEVITIKQSFFLLLGSFSPLFIYGKENYVYIRDGLISNFFFTLIIPSLLVFILLNFLLQMIGAKERIVTYIIALLIFFNAPMLNDLLKLQAESSLPFILLFFIFIYLLSLRLKPKLLKIISYVFLFAFLASSFDFLSVHLRRSSKDQRLLKKINKNTRTNDLYKKVQNKLQNKRIPNVYFLIYDGLTGPTVMNHYNLDYKLDYLSGYDFKIYGDILSNHFTSIKTIASVLEVSKSSPIKKASNQRKNMVGFNLVDRIFESFSMPRTYLASNHFFKGQIQKDGSQIESVGEESFNGLLKGVLIGEFKFDIELKHQFGGDEYEIRKHKLLKNNRGFIYVHNPYPGHSQNSGICLESDKEVYKERLEIAYKAMKKDISVIIENDPSSIIIIAGDHGGLLSGDCKGLKTRNFKGATLPIFTESHGTFLAIRWPDNNYQKYDKFESLQGVFLSIFAYIAKDESLLNYLPKGKICMGEFCTDQSGTVLNGKDKGKNVFKVLKDYELIQF